MSPIDFPRLSPCSCDHRHGLEVRRRTPGGASGLRLETVFLPAFLALSVGATSARAADPYSARYSRDSQAIFWLVHLSDSHIGASQIEGPHASEHLEWLLGEGLDVIDPSLVIATGDLCDGSRYSIPASGQEQSEWDEYRTIVDGAGMTTDLFVDMPGNHDGYADIGMGFYLASSLNGETFGVTYREVLLSFSFGDYLIYGTNTAGVGSNAFVEDPAFTAEQLADLTDSMGSASAAQLVMLFGHHPITRPDNASTVIALAQQHGAFWFHGHVHEYGTYPTSGIVSAQVNTLGKGDTDNLAVIAVDNNAVTYAATSSADPWPFVVITAPADRRLHSGDDNPYGYDVCNSDAANPVRALVFDVQPTTAVSFSAGGAAAVPMTRDPVEPRLWHGLWDTRSLATGDLTLSVTAEGSASRSASVTVRLADVACPPPVEEQPDAGTPPVDAAVFADASVSSDASPHPEADAGPPPGPPPRGCGCGADAGGAVPLVPIVLLPLFFLFVRASRRPAGQHP